MICEEFRDRWDDRDQQASDALGHRWECTACADWVIQQAVFDGKVLASLVLLPPPDLVIRLEQIPARVYETAPVETRATMGWLSSPYGLAFDVVVIAVIGFAANASWGEDLVAGFGFFLGRVGDVLQAIPLILDSPLVSYLQELASTAIEALATLLLIGLSVVQLSSESPGYRSSGERIPQ